MPTPSSALVPRTGVVRPRGLAFILTALAALVLGCAKGPTFEYNKAPGVALERLRRVAWDPRKDVIWMVEGQRPTAAPEYRAAAVQELLAKGYWLVEPEAADLWLKVIVLVPDRSRGEAPRAGGGAKGRSGGGGHGSGGRGGGGHRPEGSGDSAGRPAQGHSSGEVSVLVKLLARADQSSLWSGVATFPAPAKGTPVEPQDTPEGRMRRLLEPYPGAAPGGK